MHSNIQSGLNTVTVEKIRIEERREREFGKCRGEAVQSSIAWMFLQCGEKKSIKLEEVKGRN